MKRNLVIDHLRGLAMLGVIGIHIGTFVLDSSTPRLDIFLLLQIFTRFAVPAFFFISGYGLSACRTWSGPCSISPCGSEKT